MKIQSRLPSSLCPSMVLLLALGGSVRAQSLLDGGSADPDHVPSYVKTQIPLIQKSPVAAAPVHRARAERKPVADPIPEVLRGVLPPFELDRVFYDEPGDGSLWACGKSYKARFGSSAVRFVPYLGPGAERNLPVDFELSAVTVGGQPLPFDRTPSMHRSADLISLDRGSLTELYAMSTDSMEQLFRFESLPGSGDLVVEIDVRTTLAPVERESGFEFGCDLGCVRYGRATVLDDGGRSLAVETSLAGDKIVIRVPSGFVASADFPLTIDPVVSSFTVNAEDHLNDLFPDIAFESQSGNYMLVWQRTYSNNDWDVWCEQRNSYGGYVGSSLAIIDITDTNWIKPRVAANRRDSQFLVVAQTGPANDSTIRGRTCSTGGSPTMGSQFAISSTLSHHLNPDVGGNPTDPTGGIQLAPYYVVWEHAFYPDDHDIHGRTVSPSGILGGLKVIESSFADAAHPAVSASCGVGPTSNQVFTVVFEREASPSDRDIYGAQVDANGLTLHTVFPVNTSALDDHNPSVSTVLDGATGERPYLVVYEREQASHSDIGGIVYRGSSQVSPSTNISTLNGVLWAGRDQFAPSVDSDGSIFLVSFGETTTTGNDIYACTLGLADGSIVPSEIHRNWGTNGASESFPEVVSTHSGGAPSGNFMAVWNSFSTDFSGDLHAGRYVSPGPGEVYCTSTQNSVGSFTELSAQGSISIARNELLLLVEYAPPSKPGIIFYGRDQVNLPFGEGRRCVGGPVQRIPGFVTTDSQGLAELHLDFGHAAYGAGLHAGSPGVNLQYWFRDPQGGPAGFNLSNALHLELQP